LRVDGVPDSLLPRLSEFIAEQTGLHFPPERRPDLQRGLTAAAAELGFANSGSCADWLLSTPLTRPQLHTLASHLTVGETYFFRERKTFDALANHVLPELIRRRRGREQRLRLWSTACSTGEEPYSLAILVQQLLHDWRDWRVTILATDINENSLRKAAAGVYGEWSFRESPPGFKERYFERTPDGRFAVLPEIRNRVSFAHMNLAQDCFPSLATDTNAMDVIFCRNVLIYFTPSHARKLVENLHHALLDEAWLAVSPSECSQALFSRFVAVNFPGSILYRKCNIKEPRPSSSASVPAPVVADVYAPENVDAALADTASTLLASFAQEATQTAPPPSSQTVGDPRTFSLQARAMANQGQLADALVWSERWIAADKIDPAARYLHAMILQEVGELEAARRSLHRAVYLRPDFALAHFALGNLNRAEMRSTEANRHYANVLHLLRGCPPDELLPESDGMTAGRLAEIIATLLALPDRSPPSQEVSSNGRRER
jgi:chemotaxis protein methyltransferase CheR